MYILIFLILVALMIFFIVISVDWLIHLSMTKDEKTDYGWGSFEDFKREFGKYNWNSGAYDESTWDRQNNCKFHANIVVFNGVGMLLKSPIAFYKVKKYVKGDIKQKDSDNRNKHFNWSK